jgi:hypothetical protein
VSRRLDYWALGAVSLALMLGIIVWMDNVHFGTLNGLFKSIDIDSWKTDWRTAKLDPSNYLYYPFYALLGHGLDAVGIFTGRTWKQMAALNSVFAALNVVVMSCLIRILTGRRDAAFVAALFHLGSGFFLELATSNEDIMPGYTLVFAAMAAAAVWFTAPTHRQVVIVSALFTVGWLLEWRLMFPALPPLLLALVLSDHSIRRKALQVVVFLLAMTAIALVAANRWEGHPGAVGLPGLFWTGKGIATGWAGFSWEKMLLMLSACGEYVLGGWTIGSIAEFRARLWEWLIPVVLQAALLVAVFVVAWRRRFETRWRAVAIIFLGTLAGGQLMNAYSQPQDPQMQINVMVWLPVAVGLLAGHLLAGGSRRLAWALFVLAAVPLVYNIAAFGRLRGLDSERQGRIAALERQVDPARTALVYTGFEDEFAWNFALWQGRWQFDFCVLGPAPVASPKFKWISFLFPALYWPAETPEQHVARVKAHLDCAFDKGYRVIAGEAWQATQAELADRFLIIGGQHRVPLLYSFMHQTYSSTPLAGMPEGVRYYELKRK